MKTTEHDKTQIIVSLRDFLVGHRDRGRDIDEVISYLEKTIKKRLLTVFTDD